MRFLSQSSLFAIALSLSIGMSCLAARANSQKGGGSAITKNTTLLQPIAENRNSPFAEAEVSVLQELKELSQKLNIRAIDLNIPLFAEFKDLEKQRIARESYAMRKLVRLRDLIDYHGIDGLRELLQKLQINAIYFFEGLTLPRMDENGNRVLLLDSKNDFPSWLHGTNAILRSSQLLPEEKATLMQLKEAALLRQDLQTRLGIRIEHERSQDSLYPATQLRGFIRLLENRVLVTKISSLSPKTIRLNSSASPARTSFDKHKEILSLPVGVFPVENLLKALENTP